MEKERAHVFQCSHTESAAFLTNFSTKFLSSSQYASSMSLVGGIGVGWIGGDISGTEHGGGAPKRKSSMQLFEEEGQMTAKSFGQMSQRMQRMAYEESVLQIIGAFVSFPFQEMEGRGRLPLVCFALFLHFSFLRFTIRVNPQPRYPVP